MAPRTGLPRPDRANPGNWLPIDRESDPAAFRSLEEQAQADADTAASLARLQNLRRNETAVAPASSMTEPPVSETGGEESAIDEIDDDETGTYGPARPKKRKASMTGRPKAKKPAVSPSAQPVSVFIFLFLCSTSV